MTASPTRTVRISTIKVGDVVHTWGMRCRVDEITRYEEDSDLPVYVCHTTVLNLDEVRAAQVVPMSWLNRDHWVEGQGWTVYRRDSWNVQSNDLAAWQVETLFAPLNPEELLALSAKLRHAGDQLSQGTGARVTAWQQAASMASVEAYSLRGEAHDELARIAQTA